MSTIHWIHPLPGTADRFHLDVCPDDQGKAVIHVCGELVIVTTPLLETCLSTLLDADLPYRALEVDLSAAPFVDLGGVNVLLDAHRRATAHGVALWLTGCSAQLVRLLHVIHVLDVVDPVPPRRALRPARRPDWPFGPTCGRRDGQEPA
jgi:anti-anti-sigma factor